VITRRCGLGFCIPAGPVGFRLEQLIGVDGEQPELIRQMLVRYFFLAALSVGTAAARQVPAGASRSAVTRGSARKPARSWKGPVGASALTG
jgi:F0F1-type ATP synthase membrane subunit c/vacuolar-type H+-ATPase subunit K